MKKKTIISLIILMGIILFSVQVKAEDRLDAYNNYSFNETNNISLRMDFASDEEVAIVETWDISATSVDHVTATLYSDGKLVISGTGKMKNYYYDNIPWIANRENIITVVIEKGVTSIGNSAFEKCDNLKKVEIQEGVTSIGNDAFYDCKNIANIEIPKDVTSIDHRAFRCCKALRGINVDERNQNYSSENGVLFNKDKTKLILYPENKIETEYIIPDSVTNIENSAFSYSVNLISIDIPDSVTSIGSQAFDNCSSLTSINIPNSVTSIGHSAFWSCSNLKSVKLPEGLTKIEDWMFNCCKNLTSINIPQGVTSIGHYAFSVCESLTSIDVPGGVTSIGYSAFSSCKITSINIPEGITSIEDDTFRGCDNLINIQMPESVINIGKGAFYGCWSLASINIPEGVKSISDEAFYLCMSLTSINIPSRVTSIGDAAFEGCSSLTSIEIPEGVTSIGRNAFYRCSSLTSINIPSGVTSIGERAFATYKKLIINNIPDSVINIGKDAFYGCEYIHTVAVGENAGNEITVSIPNIVQRTFSEEDIMYANGTAPTLNKCTISEDKQKLTFNKDDVMKKNVNVTIEDGPLNGLVVVVVPSGTIFYDKTSWTNQDVTATIYIAEGEKITNNNESNNYKFTENGEFAFTYTDSEGNNKTSTAKVDWIDKQAPTITNVTGNPTNWTDEDVTLTVNAQDSLSEIKEYSFDGGTTWQNENNKTYNDNENGISIKVKDNAGNIATYTQTIDITKIRCRNGHNFGEWIIDEAETCTDKGHKHRECQICDVIENQEIPELGHDYQEEVTVPTCTEKGYTIHTCTRCNDNYVDTYTEALGHKFGEWIIDKEPTYEEEGHKYRICINCNKEKQEESIPKLIQEETYISTTYKVKEKDGQKYIILQPKTKLEEALKNITSNKKIEIVGKDNKKIETNSILATGEKVKILGEEKIRYIIVVKGDINGDGKIDFIRDIVLLNDYRLNRIKLSTESILAGDIKEDDKIDFINDIVKINNYRLNRISKL